MIPRISPSLQALSPVDPLTTISNQMLVECRMALKSAPNTCVVSPAVDQIVIRVDCKPVIGFKLYREDRVTAGYIRYEESEYPQVVADAITRVLGLLQRQRIQVR